MSILPLTSTKSDWNFRPARLLGVLEYLRIAPNVLLFPGPVFDIRVGPKIEIVELFRLLNLMFKDVDKILYLV